MAMSVPPFGPVEEDHQQRFFFNRSRGIRLNSTSLTPPRVSLRVDENDIQVEIGLFTIIFVI